MEEAVDINLVPCVISLQSIEPFLLTAVLESLGTLTRSKNPFADLQIIFSLDASFVTINTPELSGLIYLNFI